MKQIGMRPLTRRIVASCRAARALTGSFVALIAALAASSAYAQIDPAGDEFSVNTYTTGQQVLPAVTHTADGKFVAVWTSYGPDGSAGGVVGRRFDADGTRLGQEFSVNTFTTGAQTQAAVGADDGGRYVVVWTSASDQDGSGLGIFGQRYNATGGKLGGEFQVNSSTAGNQQTPDIAVLADGSFITVWQAGDGSGASITARRFDGNGVALGNNFRVNSGTAYDQILPAISAADDGSFVVVFASYGADDPVDTATAGVFARRFAANGSALGDDFQVNTFTTGQQTLPDVGVQPGGGFVVVWEDAAQFEKRSIVARLFDANGTAVDDEIIVQSDATYTRERPRVAVGGDGSFVVAWESAPQDGSSRGTFAQRFSAAGAPLGGEFQVNSFTAGSQYSAAISDSGQNNVVLVWQSPQDGSADGIYGQRFVTSSAPVGSCGDPIALTVDATASTRFGRAVTATDALAILQAAVGLLPCELCVCDVNGSATLSASDALVALQYSVGQSASLLCPPCS
jgi:hypothetical protein